LVTVKLQLHFARLPFDEHLFKMSVASYSHDQETVRLFARGGTPGVTHSGVGVSADVVSSPVWDVGDEKPIKTTGELEVQYGNWDYIHLTFDFKRRPKFVIDQILIQDFLFLFLTYAGFFVSPAAVPARAALAVIPVLIMRTLFNSVFKDLPNIGYQMWLSDYLQVSMLICVVATLELAAVQFFIQLEARQSALYANFKKNEGHVDQLVELARHRKVPLRTIIKEHLPVEKGNKRVSYFNQAEKRPSERSERSPKATSKNPEEPKDDIIDTTLEEHVELVQGPKQAGKVTEEQIAVLNKTLDLFKKFDTDTSAGEEHSMTLNVNECQMLLRYFGFYFLKVDIATTVCRCLRDHGFSTPLNEMEVEMKFAQFVEYVFELPQHQAIVPKRFTHPLSKAYPPSIRCETATKWFFPLLIIGKTVLFYALRPSY
jgi:hypothetical protein